MGDEEGAMEAARRALELAPLDVSSPLVAAECPALAGRYDEALVSMTARSNSSPRAATSCGAASVA